MDPKDIRELIEIISRSNFSAFELEEKDFKLKLVKAEPVSAAPAAAIETPEPRLEAPAAAAETPGAETPAAPVVADGSVELTVQ